MDLIERLSTGITKFEQIEKLKAENCIVYEKAIQENDEPEIMITESNISFLNQMLFNNGTSLIILSELCETAGYFMEINDGLIIGIYRNKPYFDLIESCRNM